MTENLNVKIFADGADLNDMLDVYKKGIVKGFTTNPSLMKKAGITDYKKFAKDVLSKIKDMPVSFEVFSDDFTTMEKEAEVLASLGENVYIKIPVTNTKGESSVPLIKKLSDKGYHLNVTAIFTLSQVEKVVAALKPGNKSIVSVFAGRIADTGTDPVALMINAKKLCSKVNGAELLWASCREVYNILEADKCGCDIITVTNDVLKKLSNVGKDLSDYSLETVRGFYKDASSLGFSVL